jgi:hypothetical protein
VIQFDQEAWEAVRKDRRMKLERCRDDVLTLLGHHYPTPLSPLDLHHIFLRYYSFKRRRVMLEAFENFMGLLLNEHDVNTVYQHENLIGYVIERTAETRQYTGLPHCLQPIRECYAESCAHAKECDRYIDTRELSHASACTAGD